MLAALASVFFADQSRSRGVLFIEEIDAQRKKEKCEGVRAFGTLGEGQNNSITGWERRCRNDKKEKGVFIC